MAEALPAITRKQLIRLLRRDGWQEQGRRTHGIAFAKRDAGGVMRVTLIPDKRSPLPSATLAPWGGGRGGRDRAGGGPRRRGAERVGGRCRRILATGPSARGRRPVVLPARGDRPVRGHDVQPTSNSAAASCPSGSRRAIW